jgi:hypothetical protein
MGSRQWNGSSSQVFGCSCLVVGPWSLVVSVIGRWLLVALWMTVFRMV